MRLLADENFPKPAAFGTFPGSGSDLDVALHCIYNDNRGVRLGRRQRRAPGPEQDHAPRHSGEERVCFGRTVKGRLLTIIYTMRGGAIRVVTGYPMTKAQQRIYFEGR